MRAQAAPYDRAVSKLLEVVRNPVAYIAARWTPTQRTVQRATLTALVLSVIIIVSGGAVRLTGSGLGCDTWPKCSDDSLTATSEMGFHGAVEFGNRMMTWVLSAGVGWAIIVVRAAKPARPELSRLAWSQFWLVMANGVIGGITVLTKLNPYTVAGHFLLATALLTVTALTWLRAREGDAPPRPLVGKAIKQLVYVLAVVSALLITVGTVVTGSGKHAGDSSDVPRMPVDWKTVAQVHADLAWVVVALTLALWFVLRAVDAPVGPKRRTRDLFIILMCQGAIGYVQYFTDVPELLVAAHLLGSTAVWIGVLRVLLSLRERGLPQTEVPGAGETEASIPAPVQDSEKHEKQDAAPQAEQTQQDAPSPAPSR
ncbi:heme A synthase [Streptomyces sp. NPDC048172]|uniref:COX15/CtaA family protein n=1 Tax=Streptomyces sp. NPDC048172 TaxID=3365505 RepID=UPI003723D2C3